MGRARRRIALFRDRLTPAAPDNREKPAPSAWEKLLVDAAVIGGRDRWARRLHGLEREFELRLQRSNVKTMRPRAAISSGSSINFASSNNSRFR